MKPLQLALIRQRYTPFGGAERFVSRAMDALKAQGASITLLTREWEGGGDALICDPFYLGSLWRDWGFARCVCRTLARHNFDLVQSHERVSCCDIYRAGDGVHREWLAQRGRVLGPLRRFGVWLNPYHRYTLGAERRLFASPQLKAVICNSRMVKAEIMRHFGVAEDKLHVIYSGVDLEAFHPRLKETYRLPVRTQLGIPGHATLFLFVGSGFERKGLAAALRALPPAAYLAVAGHDRRARDYSRLAAQLGIAERVRFLGPQQDVKPYYGAADALVLPTLYDPFPNVALEALACGLPVVTSTQCGAAELLAETGLVVDALDTDALGAAMTALLDKNHRSALSEQARRLASEYGLQAMADNLLRLYGELMPRAGV
ncbi:MAG: glycosyltransferase family 4 protein [Hydrogenophilales bacterium]|nr:glycosyltransferase family 4 protein [Hydrogenophilales bacterium]